jgi:hypothetical protein
LIFAIKYKAKKHYLGEALSTAVYLIKLSPSYPLEGDVPNKVYYGKDVSYDGLNILGCKEFAHISQDERSKLHSNTEKGGG